MISFIIPTLNEEKTIENTLKCLASYGGEKEIIVSDGKSSDKTVEIARKYADKVLVYSDEKRQTIAAGRNAGALEARGDFLVFLDADVTIPEINSFFEKCRKLFSDPGLTAMTVFYKVVPEAATLADKVIFKALGLYFYILNKIGIGASGGEFQMIRVEAFKKAGGFNEELAASEDMEMFWKLAKIGRTHLEKSLFIYQSGRRAHKTGWLKLLLEWSSNCVSAFLLKKSRSKVWEEVR